jgi:hypothetical protein
VEEDDDTTAETARDALAAIEKMRLTAANKRGGAAEPDAPAAPVVETVATTPKSAGKCERIQVERWAKRADLRADARSNLT